MIVAINLLRDIPPVDPDSDFARTVKRRIELADEEESWHGEYAHTEIDGEASVGEILLDLQVFYHANHQIMLTFVALWGYLNQAKIGGGEKHNTFDRSHLIDDFANFAGYITGLIF